jgi:hypothetical protein
MHVAAKSAALVTAVVLVVPGPTATAEVAPFGAVGAVAVSPATGRVLVGIDDRKPGACLWWSDDQGAHWHVARGLGRASGVTALAFSHSQPNTVYAGVIWLLPEQSLGSGLLVSGDGGASWHAASWKQRITVFGRTIPAAIDELVVDPSRPATVYADTHGVLRRTLNGARTWTLAQTGLPPTVGGGGPGEVGVAAPRDQQLVADAGGTLYFATGHARGRGQIYRSTSRGGSWQPAAQGLPAAPAGSQLLQLATDVTGPAGIVYAAGDRGVYATRNAGRTWSRILRTPARTVGTTRGAVFVLTNPQALGSGVPRLLRRGGTGAWTRLNAPAIDAFALDPMNSGRLYAWSYDADASRQRYCARLFGSSDGGRTWASIGRTLPLVRLNCRRS